MSCYGSCTDETCSANRAALAGFGRELSNSGAHKAIVNAHTKREQAAELRKEYEQDKDPDKLRLAEQLEREALEEFGQAMVNREAANANGASQQAMNKGQGGGGKGSDSSMPPPSPPSQPPPQKKEEDKKQEEPPKSMESGFSLGNAYQMAKDLEKVAESKSSPPDLVKLPLTAFSSK